MKLIIDISEEDYDFIKTRGNPRMYGFEAIQNGIPLDSVKLDIANIDTFERAGCWVMADVLKILNNIGNAESEET